MLTIGLCGGSGSGKGFVASEFMRYGIPSIDTDRVYAEMTAKGGRCIPELREAFGDGIILPDGSLDRVALSKIVFSGDSVKQNKELLERITHRHILGEVRRILSCYAKSEQRPPAVLVDAPLLYESGFDRECHAVIAVICDENIRISRITERDGISRDAAVRRIRAQIPDDKLSELADFVIINDGKHSISEQVLTVANNILRRR